MSDPSKRVHCAHHGETAAAFICQHLRLGRGLGFHTATEDLTDRWPDAWCSACDAAFQREGAWTDTSEPPITFLCTGCYEVVRDRNA